MHDDASASSHLLVFVRENLLSIGLGLVGMILLLYGLISFLPRPKEDTITFESAKPQSMKDIAPVKNTEQIVVDVAGAVLKPGVYTLPADARIQDALIKAGGMNAEADQKYVASALNLAAPLVDGSKVYIPFVGDNASRGSTVLGDQASQINVNTASISELDTLPGVGQVTAQKIIKNRPYKTVEELVEKNVLKQSAFSKLKDLISTY